MDQNGWSFRKVFLQSNDGKIYEATLNIADGRDRRILYEINNVKLVDKKKTSASIPSTDESQRSSYQEHKMGRTQSEVTEESEDSTDGNTITLDSKEVKQLDSFDRKNPDIRYSISEREQDADLTENDLVFITNGGCVENATMGSQNTVEPFNPEIKPGGGWDMWRRIAAQDPSFGHPDKFCHDPESPTG